MGYTPPSQGRGDRRLNTTNYEHPQETNLLDVARALQYRYLTGEPELRVHQQRRRFVQNCHWPNLVGGLNQKV